MNKSLERTKAGLLAGVEAGKAQAVADRRLAAEADLGRAVGLLSLEAVHQREADTRPARADHVLSLAESVAAVGLVQPVAVDKHGRLVAGLHRLEACRLLLTAPEDRAARWHQLQGADKVPADEAAERLAALPAPDALLDPLRAGKVPVRRLLDLDAEADPDAALAAEGAENTARRSYTRAEVGALVDRLRAAGYRETGGRPRRGERALRPALELVLGISRNTARRMLGTLPDAAKGAHVGTFSDMAKAADRLNRAALAYVQALEDLPAGQRARAARDLARQARVVASMAPTAVDELHNLEGDAE